MSGFSQIVSINLRLLVSGPSISEMSEKHWEQFRPKDLAVVAVCSEVTCLPPNPEKVQRLQFNSTQAESPF